MSPRFRPRRLRRASVEAPLERRWDVMGPEEAARLHAQAQAEVARFGPFAPRTRRARLRCFVLTPVGFAAVGFFFAGTSLRAIGAFTLAGLFLGSLTYLFRPLDFLSGLLYGLAGLLGMVVGGLFHPVRVIPVVLLCMGIGILQGRVEEWRRLDMED